MAQNTAAKAVASHVISISKKQTVQSTGIWETLRRLFAVHPERSNGVPLNPYFRNPAPGSLDPHSYTDPVSYPAGDIADNPYWKRDVRRNHPQLSVLSQPHVAALVRLGSAETPRVELIGEAGEKALVEATKEGSGGLVEAIRATTGQLDAKDGKGVFFVNGLPPLPSGQTKVTGEWKVHQYELIPEQSYPDGEYPCRSFT